MQINHILGQNGFGPEFKNNSCKMSLWRSAAKHFLKTMVSRRFTVFCKLVIVFLVVGLNKNFKVRDQKCRFDQRNRRTRWIRRLKGVWHYFAHWSSFWSQRGSGRFLPQRLQIDDLMIRKKNKLRTIIMRRLTVFCKVAFLCAGIGFSDKFTVKAPKCDYDGKHQKTRSKRRLRDL